MLTRCLEPEVMDTADDAHDYDSMDHSTVNRVFTDDLLTFVGTSGLLTGCSGDRAPLTALDVGTGTAQIPIELCRRAPAWRITAIDLAAEMLKLARQNIARAELDRCIQVEQVDAKSLPYANGAFDAVISNSIVHHIPEPSFVLTEMLRVLRPGGVLFVRDLLRPQSLAEVDQLVKTYAGNENAHSQQLFRDSLRAALSLEEVQDLATRRGVPASAVHQTTDRHWTLAWMTSPAANSAAGQGTKSC